MTDLEMPAFVAVFQQLRQVFGLRGSPDDVAQLEAVYFRLLRRYPLPLVESAAALWLHTGARFPKPADWIGALPKATTPQASGLLPVPEDEAAELRDAIAWQFEAAPCSCHLCVRAGVSHRFLRHVPLEDDDGRVVQALLDGRRVTRGRWLHGDELAEWYRARDAFQATMQNFPKAFPTGGRMATRRKIAKPAEPVQAEPAQHVLPPALPVVTVAEDDYTALLQALTDDDPGSDQEAAETLEALGVRGDR